VRLDDAAELEFHDSLPSTNERALEWAREGAPPFSVVVAREQTAGRGRQGRSWRSPLDGGLWISIILPTPRRGASGAVPILVGVSVARAVEEVSGVRPFLKWPNDLLLSTRSGPAGWRKVGGILCQTGLGRRPDRIVAGVGVNLRTPPVDPPETSGPSTSAGSEAERGMKERRGPAPIGLDEACDHPPSREALAQALLAELRRVADPPPAILSETVLREWARRDLLLGRDVRVERTGRGRAQGIDSDGALRLEQPDGTIAAILSGGVRIIGEGSSALFTGGSPAGSDDRRGEVEAGGTGTRTGSHTQDGAAAAIRKGDV
jgi:BirA family transcriptional regulator, biotin operon repressor / biotin---[acetyl-CoA-carboxylase] ligase